MVASSPRQTTMRRIHLYLLLPILLCSALAACGGSAPVSEEKETFVWGEQGVRISPPPGEWERHRWQQGGLEGVSFQIRRVPPGRILVADYRSLHRKHSRIGTNSGRVDFTPAPENATLDEVLDRVLFDPASMPVPDSVRVQEIVEREVGGERAYAMDFTWHDGRNPFQGREVYVLANESLFKITLLGTEKDLKLFEKVVESVEFPDPEDLP